MSNLKVERELERKLKVLEVEEERRLKALTVKQHKIEQETLKLRVHTRSRPRHGENRLKRDRALASLPCSPISRRNNWRCSTSTESSGSSQEEYSSFPPLNPQQATPIPTILITDTERGVLSSQSGRSINSPLSLTAHRDYVNRIHVLSGSLPSLITCKRSGLKQDIKPRSPTNEIFKLPPILSRASFTSSNNKPTSIHYHTLK